MKADSSRSAFQTLCVQLQPAQMEERVGLLLYKCTLDDFLRTEICNRPRQTPSLLLPMLGAKWHI